MGAENADTFQEMSFMPCGKIINGVRCNTTPATLTMGGWRCEDCLSKIVPYSQQ